MNDGNHSMTSTNISVNHNNLIIKIQTNLTSPLTYRHSIMVRYTGRGPRDAAKIIDASQGKPGHGKPSIGHPRAHVSDPSAKGLIGSVERYSKNKPRTGFLSREDQDMAVHLSLKSEKGELAINALNSGSSEKSIHLTRSMAHRIDSTFEIQAQEWYNGEPRGMFTPDETTTVIQHQQEKKTTIEADPHILTCYPRRKRKREKEERDEKGKRQKLGSKKIIIQLIM